MHRSKLQPNLAIDLGGELELHRHVSRCLDEQPAQTLRALQAKPRHAVGASEPGAGVCVMHVGIHRRAQIDVNDRRCQRLWSTLAGCERPHVGIPLSRLRGLRRGSVHRDRQPDAARETGETNEGHGDREGA